MNTYDFVIWNCTPSHWLFVFGEEPAARHGIWRKQTAKEAAAPGKPSQQPSARPLLADGITSNGNGIQNSGCQEFGMFGAEGLASQSTKVEPKSMPSSRRRQKQDREMETDCEPHITGSLHSFTQPKSGIWLMASKQATNASDIQPIAEDGKCQFIIQNFLLKSKSNFSEKFNH
jgi:hypothetical protein